MAFKLRAHVSIEDMATWQEQPKSPPVLLDCAELDDTDIKAVVARPVELKSIADADWIATTEIEVTTDGVRQAVVVAYAYSLWTDKPAWEVK